MRARAWAEGQKPRPEVSPAVLKHKQRFLNMPSVAAVTADGGCLQAASVCRLPPSKFLLLDSLPVLLSNIWTFQEAPPLSVGNLLHLNLT